ncbi:MAG: CHAD domain-containing protein [Acidobacteriota bacterium]
MNLAEAQLSEGAWEWMKLRRIAARQMDKCASLIPVTLMDGNIDAVNELRVTTRRMEQILDLLYSKRRPKRIRKLAERLRDYRHVLGSLRDDDALLALVEEARNQKSNAHMEAWGAVKGFLEARRAHNAPRIIEKCSGINLMSSYGKLKDKWIKDGQLCQGEEDSGHSASLQGERADRVCRGITRSLDRRWGAFEDAVRKSGLHPGERTIHRMRIAAKRFRYLTESLDKLHIAGSAETEAWLHTLQQVVGRWHDRELLGHAMTELLAKHGFGRDQPGLRDAVKQLVVHNRQVKAGLERKFAEMSKKSLPYRKTGVWVAKTIADNKSSKKKARKHVSKPNHVQTGQLIHSTTERM